MQFQPFKVSNLISAEVGTEEEYEVSEYATHLTEEDPELIEKISFEVTLLKAKDRIEADFTDLETEILVPCARCLKKIPQAISIPFFNYSYLIDTSGLSEEERVDNFSVDVKNNLIDVSEALRNEILLATDVFTLCKISCKGLCPICGKDLNTGTCQCRKVPEKIEENKPFAHLKNLVKDEKKKGKIR